MTALYQPKGVTLEELHEDVLRFVAINECRAEEVKEFLASLTINLLDEIGCLPLEVHNYIEAIERFYQETGIEDR